MKRATLTTRGSLSIKVGDQKDSSQLIKAVFANHRKAVNVTVSIAPDADKPELLLSVGESFQGKMFDVRFPISERSADLFSAFHKELDKSSPAESTIVSWLFLFINAVTSNSEVVRGN
ncbi:MAG: hypothetical protein HQL22_06500 [Candidatus Omnitrophica bacterium]|nr:hypothetical protein [Candidatus Omnitrophota bacterium]